MPEATAMVHISSAIVRCLPAAIDTLRREIAAMEDTEIAHQQDNKLVLVLEGASAGAIGARLTEISALQGVVSAVMVYEQVETAESLGEEA